MKRQTSHREWIEMVERHQRGMSYQAIADPMLLHKDTVRHGCRAYRDGGWEALYPAAIGRQHAGR